MGTNHDARRQLAQTAGQTEAFEENVAQLGREENQAQLDD